MQSTLGNSNCSFVKAFIYLFRTTPWASSHILTQGSLPVWPQIVLGWGLGSGRRSLLWRAAESTCSCGLAFISMLQLDAVYVDCLMANWCSVCEDTVSCMRQLWVAIWVVSTWYQFPQSIWSIQWEKKKEEKESVQPENQSEQLPEVIETSKLLDKIFHVWTGCFRTLHT